mgnify:CR=1 FL=1
MTRFIVSLIIVTGIFASCKKEKNTSLPTSTFDYVGLTVDGLSNGFSYNNVAVNPVIKISFSADINHASVNQAVSLKDNEGNIILFSTSVDQDKKTLVILPATALKPFTKYILSVTNNLETQNGDKLRTSLSITLNTGIDTTDKFPVISDEELLTLVQKQTFKYFWDFAHPVSGLARERDSSGDIVTTGGSGFGIMAIVTGIHRNFITRQEGLQRMQKIVGFLKDKADRFHGAFPHWLNGSTGKKIAFSAKDDGADLVETSLLMQGLLTARQYFNRPDIAEAALRDDINSLWNEVEWSWFRKGNENVLYWHWSPNHQWEMNHPIKGWNEALITYVLAASSSTHPVPKAVYDEGWASNGAIRNGNSYFGISLPLGPPNGGPLFFSHYSFLGINPKGLTDKYANYETQNTAHSLIHYNYAKANPKGFFGYGENCWGFTASDDINGYLAHEPNNDNGVISPTAALSSFPYTPDESMKALKFFYYKLGDKIWKDYGFIDAFSLHHAWFSNSYLAIDQGPIIIMIENHRSGLLWNLFMSSPEIINGMKTLGFQSPYL